MVLRKKKKGGNKRGKGHGLPLEHALSRKKNHWFDQGGHHMKADGKGRGMGTPRPYDGEEKRKKKGVHRGELIGQDVTVR